MRQIKCLYDDGGSEYRPMTILAEVRNGELVELDPDMPLTAQGTGETLMGWGRLDGPARHYARQGIGRYVIPEAELQRIGLVG